MTEIDFKNIVGPMPAFVSIDLRSQVARLNSMTTFDYLYPDPKQRCDAILSKVICSLTDRQFINEQIASMARYFSNTILLAIENASLINSERVCIQDSKHPRSVYPDSRLSVMEDMISFEQTCLDIADELQQLKLYRYNRFLPYLYETTLNPRSVILSKIDSFEYLCEQIPTLCMSPFTESD